MAILIFNMLQTTITCTDADELALALQTNDETSEFLYGTSTYQSTTEKTLLGVAGETYANRPFDCAKTGPAVTANNTACAGG